MVWLAVLMLDPVSCCNALEKLKVRNEQKSEIKHVHRVDQVDLPLRHVFVQ